MVNLPGSRISIHPDSGAMNGLATAGMTAVPIVGPVETPVPRVVVCDSLAGRTTGTESMSNLPPRPEGAIPKRIAEVATPRGGGRGDRRGANQ